MKTILTGIIVTALLCGCGSDTVWKKQTFAFSAPTGPPAVNASTDIIALHPVSVSPLFQNQCFTYRIGDSSYEHDPYAAFLASPEHTIGEAIGAYMRHSSAFGNVAEPGSGIVPNLIAEARVNQLYGDFRSSLHPIGLMEIHFTIYEGADGLPVHPLLDKTYASETALSKKSPTALMTAWETDLHEIMEKLSVDLGNTKSK